MRRIAARIAGAPARRPWLTLALAGVITGIAILCATHLRMDTSLNAMFPRNDPAATAMLRVLDGFGTTDELLVLVTIPDGEKEAEPDRLIEYAQRFESATKASPAASSLCDGVLYRLDPGVEKFIEEKLTPAAIYYLDDATLARARERLTRAEMQAQLNKDEVLMSQPGPGASAMAKALMKDPLSLHDFLGSRLADASPLRTYQNSDAMISQDGRALLIRVLGKRAPTDLDYSKSLTLAFTEIAQKAEPRGLAVSLTGAYAIAAHSESAIRHDAESGIAGSVGLLMALFVIVYRRPVRMFCLAFIPVAIGTVWGFGFYAIARQSLSPIAAVIGGVLAGMAIDYSVLYLTCFETLRQRGASVVDALEMTMQEIGSALLAAWVTSVAGFAAIGWSQVSALRDFSIVGSLGLAGSFLATIFVLPAAIVVVGSREKRTPRDRNTFRFEMSGAIEFIRRRSKLLAGSAIVIAIAALVLSELPGGRVLQPEQDLTVMHPQPNPPLDAEVEFTKRFGVAPGSMLVYLRVDRPEELLPLACEVQGRLAAKSVKDAGVTGTLGLGSWLPDPAIVARRRKELTKTEADRVADKFKKTVAESPFDPKAFEGYAEFLRAALTPGDAPTIMTLRNYPAVARNLLPRDWGAGTREAVCIVFLKNRTEDRTARDSAIDAVRGALSGLPGATLTGLPVVGHDAEATIWKELSRLLLAATALVAGYLLIHFRNLREMFLALVPGIFGFVVLAAVVRIEGIKLNMINLVALPLLVGIDVDYGIYLVTLARKRMEDNSSRRRSLASGAHAVMVCSTSMVVGYASLAFTSVPAVRSLGIVVATGVALCVAGAFFVLCPMLLRRDSD